MELLNKGSYRENPKEYSPNDAKAVGLQRHRRRRGRQHSTHFVEVEARVTLIISGLMPACELPQLTRVSRKRATQESDKRLDVHLHIR